MMSLRASATIIGLRDLFAFSVRCLNHCTRALSGWNFTMRQASWIMILRTRVLPERERPFPGALSRFHPVSRSIRHNGLQLCDRVVFGTEAHAPKDRLSPNQARKFVPADKPSCSQEPPASVQTAAAGPARSP